MVIVKPEDCVGCEACVDECPVEAISMTADEKALIDQDACTECEACLESCPSEAIITK